MDWQDYLSIAALGLTFIAAAPALWLISRNDAELMRRFVAWQQEHRWTGLVVFVVVVSLATLVGLSARELTQDHSVALQAVGVSLEVLAYAAIVVIIWRIYFWLKRLPRDTDTSQTSH